MKNNLWILLFSVIVTFSSCITAAQFNNADDDVYYSPKASNQKHPVMIPEVDVDEIIKQNPPQYGQPTNRIDDYDNTNPNAALYYPAYRAYQDSINSQNARVSYNYVDPDLATESETEEAERLRRIYNDGSGNWNIGLGWNWWGPTFSVGYSNYSPGYYGYNRWNYGYNGFYNPSFYPMYGWGWGYSPFYNPYYNWGWGYNSWYGSGYGWNGYYNPWWGGGYYYRPSYNWYNSSYWNGERGNYNPPQSRPRGPIGRTTPPPSTGGGRSSTNNGTDGMYTAPAQSNQNTQQAPVGVQQNTTRSGNGTYTPPAQPNQNTQQAPVGVQQNTTRSGNNTYQPSTPSQSLRNVNGRQVYTRPAPTQPAQQQQQNTSTIPPTYQAPSRSTNRNSTGGTTNYQTTKPSNPTPTYTPSGSGSRSSGSNSGSRSSGGNSGSSGGGGGRRR